MVTVYPKPSLMMTGRINFQSPTLISLYLVKVVLGDCGAAYTHKMPLQKEFT